MGNQATHLHQAAQQQQSAVPPAAGAEPLESFAKEKQRDEHLKNLGFKRSKSLRRSISKKLRKVNKRKRDSNDDVPDGGDAVPDGPKESQESHKSQCGSKESNKERVPSIEKLDRADVPEAERRPRPAVGEPQPLPSHVAVSRKRFTVANLTKVWLVCLSLVQGGPSGRRLHFVDFDLVVTMSALFCLGRLKSSRIVMAYM